jgi:poly(A) polymerase
MTSIQLCLCLDGNSPDRKNQRRIAVAKIAFCLINQRVKRLTRCTERPSQSKSQPAQLRSLRAFPVRPQHFSVTLRASKLSAPTFLNDLATRTQRLSREQHSISRKQISNAALRVLYGLKDAGFSAYLVGGAVRDLLNGGAPKDFDVATNATPDQIYKLFRTCRLVGRRFVIAHVRFGEEIIEVTTFRGSDGAGERTENEEGRLLYDNVFGSIEDDAWRRDFSINALYYSIEDFSILDIVGGLEDLQKRELRILGSAATRYREDPVRMLRAARLQAKLGFALEAETEHQIGELSSLLADIPPARLFDEFLKLFTAGHAVASFQTLQRLALFDCLFPCFDPATQKRAQNFLISAFSNTDARIELGKGVSPAFLFAALGYIWIQLRLQDQGKDLYQIRYDERGVLFDQALNELSERIAIPKRYSVPVREIWDMQGRLMETTPVRAQRLLGHPRFRAGYDFLLLRAYNDERLHALAQRWTDAQAPDADFKQLFGLKRAPSSDAEFDMPAPTRRKRKRPAAKPSPDGTE